MTDTITSDPAPLSFTEEAVANRMAEALKKVLSNWFDVTSEGLDNGEWCDIAKEVVAEMGTAKGLPPGVAPPMRDRPFLDERQFMETARMQYQMLYRMFGGESLDAVMMHPMRYDMASMRYQTMHFDFNSPIVRKGL